MLNPNGLFSNNTVEVEHHVDGPAFSVVNISGHELGLSENSKISRKLYFASPIVALSESGKQFLNGVFGPYIAVFNDGYMSSNFDRVNEVLLEFKNKYIIIPVSKNKNGAIGATGYRFLGPTKSMTPNPLKDGHITIDVTAPGYIHYHTSKTEDLSTAEDAFCAMG